MIVIKSAWLGAQGMITNNIYDISHLSREGGEGVKLAARSSLIRGQNWRTSTHYQAYLLWFTSTLTLFSTGASRRRFVYSSRLSTHAEIDKNCRGNDNEAEQKYNYLQIMLHHITPLGLIATRIKLKVDVANKVFVPRPPSVFQYYMAYTQRRYPSSWLMGVARDYARAVTVCNEHAGLHVIVRKVLISDLTP